MHSSYTSFTYGKTEAYPRNTKRMGTINHLFERLRAPSITTPLPVPSQHNRLTGENPARYPAWTGILSHRANENKHYLSNGQSET